MKRHTAALILYTILALLIFYPVLLNINDTIPENLGDPLLNTWILAWDVKQLLNDPGDLFNANIFYPYDNTLSYSDHLIVPALISLPVISATDNPVLGYNLLFLLSFALSGFGMYLFVYHLTENRTAALLSGMIYAFSPFKFNHLGHIQVLNTQWIPFALLYLHRYLEQSNLKNILLFALFFTFQVLSSTYYALYLPIIILIIMAYKGLSGAWRLRFHHLLHGIAALILISLATLPSFLHYRELSREFSFARSVQELEYFSADVLSYIAVPVRNLIYGGILETFARPEGISFLGFTVIAIILYGLLRHASPSVDKPIFRNRLFRYLDNLLNLLIIISLIAVALILSRDGGITLYIFGQKISLSRVYNPIFYILVMLLLKLFLNLFRFDRPRKNDLILYYVIFTASFLLSLGPTIKVGGKSMMPGPYAALYHFVPGFEGLRSPGRFALFAVAALSVLFGMHYSQICKRVSRKGAYILSFILAALILAEFYTGPVEVEEVPTKNNIPPIYRWVRDRPEADPIAELPMGNIWRETGYVYASTFHWKRLLNGYSGFFPPMYNYAREVLNWFPSRDSIDLLRHMGVKYLLVHSDFYRNNPQKFRKRLSRFRDELKVVEDSYGELVFQITDTTTEEKRKVSKDRKILVPAGRDWVITSNKNVNDVSLALDRDIKTRWSTLEHQEPGDYVQVDLGEGYNVEGISLWLNDDPYDFPRGCIIQTSLDGEAWQSVEGDYSCIPPPNFYLHDPKNTPSHMRFRPVRARFIKIVQVHASERYYWSINEMKIYGRK